MNVTRKFNLTGLGRRNSTTCMVEMNVDVERLINALGEKAFLNKTRKTKAMHGLIVVKVRPCDYGVE